MQRNTLEPHSLLPWARIHSVELDGVMIESVGTAGLGIKAVAGILNHDKPLAKIPRDLVICHETVEVQAKSDSHLKQLLTAVGPFASTSRGKFTSTKCVNI